MKRWIWLSCLLWAVLCGGRAQTLAERLEQLLNDPVLRTSEVGLAVYDLTDNRSVFTYQDKKLYRPASVEKLITGITALEQLGPDYLFTTSLCHTGTVEDSVLHGDVYVVGRFDSEFGEEEMTRLVNRLHASPVRRIEGRLIGDVSFADSLYYGDGWSWNDAVYEFQPCLSPLMFCKGVVDVTAVPVQGDTVARLSVSPASTYYTLKNDTRCRRPDAGAFRVTRNWMEQGNALIATGNVTGRTVKHLSLHDSQSFFMHVFAERLSGSGILLSDSLYTFGELPADTLVPVTPIAEVSHTLREVLTRALKKSDNLSAEAILRHLALKGEKSKHLSASDGVEIIGKTIRRMGYDPKNYCIVDGSGVSLYNYVSPDLLLAFLKRAYDRPELYAVLKEALPMAGVDGTLQYRMRGTRAQRRVFAKTGTLAGISSLAGYAQASNGHLLAFVIINQNVLKGRLARAFQDKVCVELCK